MSVAESMVILAPMRQVGWASASSGVARATRSGRASRKGPPDAVRISFRTAAGSSPTRHCQMAECSESIGRSHARGVAKGSPPSPPRRSARSCARGMTRWPPATRVSLFAVATTFPAPSAARTAARLTTPPVATTTRSMASSAASVASASVPPTVRVPAGRSRSFRAASSAIETRRGCQRAICSRKASMSLPAASATT